MLRPFLMAFLAYALWGCFPLYFNLLTSIAPTEVLVHRIIWACVFTIFLLAVTGRIQGLYKVLQSKRAAGSMFLASILIALNWLIFIWAVGQHRVLETSLGYFMTPLVSLMLGRFFLKENINRIQWLSASLAVLAIGLELFTLGKLPWVSLSLAMSFGLYGLIRKRQTVDSLTGLSAETLMLLPAALIYIWWLPDTPSFSDYSIPVLLLLAGSGVLTAIPLLLFASAARKLDLVVVGFIMYINPSLQFLIAVSVFGEAVTMARMITFALIWAALGLFMYGVWRQHRQRLVINQAEAI